MQTALVLGYTFLFLFLFRRIKFFRLESISPNVVSIVFIFKVIAGCSLGLLYTYYYTDRTTADTFKFFDDGRIIFNQLLIHPKDFFSMLTGIDGNSHELDIYYSKMNAWYNKDVLFNDNKTMIRLNALFDLFSIGYYYVNVVFINLISFTGLVALFKLFQSYQMNKSKELFLAVMFLPSVLFWGSGLLKDGLLIFALGMFLYSFNNLVVNRPLLSPKNPFLLRLMIPVSCFILLIITKLYVIIIIFPGIVAWYWSKNDSIKKVIAKFSITYIVYFTIAFNIGSIMNKYDVSDLIYWKQKNFFEQARLTEAKSVITIPTLEKNVLSIIQNSPHAIVNVLTRPSISDTSSPLIMISALENILILAIIIVCLLSKGAMKNVPSSLFIFSIFFVFLMFNLIGLITPILGAIVRYKVPALPFLMFIFICIYDREKLIRKFGGIRHRNSNNV